MKTILDMSDILEGFIRYRKTTIPYLNTVINHLDCQDTDGDGNVECYFYIDALNKTSTDIINKCIAKMLGVEKTDMIEDETDSGHEGEIRLEYIVNLKSGYAVDN